MLRWVERNGGLEADFFFGYSLFGPCNVSDDGTLLVFTGPFIKGVNLFMFPGLGVKDSPCCPLLTSSPTKNGG